MKGYSGMAGMGDGDGCMVVWAGNSKAFHGGRGWGLKRGGALPGEGWCFQREP